MIAMKNWKLLIILALSIFLTACMPKILTADTLPWIGDEPILFKDSFLHQTGGWSTYEDPLSFAGYAEGGFRLWTSVPHYQIWSLSGLHFKDTLTYVRAEKLGGPDDNLFGILCRFQDKSHFYALVISSDGYFGIFRRMENKLDLIDQTYMEFSEIINRGEAANEIQAVCQGGQLALIVNEKLLLQVQDDHFGYGDVGLIVGNFSEAGVDILFDDFIVMKR